MAGSHNFHYAVVDYTVGVIYCTNRQNYGLLSQFSVMDGSANIRRRRILAAAALCLISAALGCRSKAQPASQSAPPPVEVVAKDAAAPPAHINGARVREYEFLSPVYQIDKLYPSMQGPQSSAQVHLETEPEELLWIVGFQATMVDEQGDKPVSQEFMCHTNLDINASYHRDILGADKSTSGRLFTLSQGQYHIDMPDGFGIPLLAKEAIGVTTQVLNLNVEGKVIDVRHSLSMFYVRDSELTKELKPLYVASAYGLKVIAGNDGHHGMMHSVDPKAAGFTACLPGENAGKNTFDDGMGRSFTGHWVVPPGREVNHTRVTSILDLQFDTTVHYIAVHLHPFAESLELRDLSSNTTIFKATTRQADKGIGLAHVDHFSSTEGIPLYESHEYELVSVYNNTSNNNQDSMAVMNLYLLDKEFDKDMIAPQSSIEPPAAPPGHEM